MSVPYYVDLFYEDIGFTNDYSNVLQFNSKEEREAYFDNIAHYRMENTQFNNMNIEGNSVKIAFYDLQSVDLDEINYLRIATRLYGSSTTIDTLEYGFVIDYSVITSAEDCTVVEFTFEKDIWMNYQFNFTLKECNIERSHMDRWNTDGTIKYTRPCMDALESYMKLKKSQEIDKRYRFKTRIHNTTQGTYYDKYVKENIALVLISHVIGSSIENKLIPIIMSNYTIEEGEVITGFISLHDSNGYKMFPTKNSIANGAVLNTFNINPEQIINISVIYNPSIEIQTEENGEYFTNKFYDMNDREMPLVAPDYNYVSLALATPGNEASERFTSEIIIDKSLPVLPENGDNYSNTHEPMLYKSPIIKRYITSYMGDEVCEISDVFINLNTIYITNLFSAIGSSNILSFSRNIAESSLQSGNMQMSAINAPILSDPWKSYAMTYRNTDRELMWTNILTAGLVDAGSTGISAGIGYRANQERAEMANIQRSMVDGRTKYGRALKAESQMYGSFAKQAAGMSIAGGVVQFGANAYSTYKGQELKEQSIKNTPTTAIKMGEFDSYLYADIDKNLEYVELVADDESYNQYANIFKKFGYAIYGVIQPNIKSRKYFNYIKTAGAILTGNVNQAILANLAVLFDKGMTIWHMDCTTKDTLYTYNKENIERTLMVSDYNYTQIATIEDWDAAVSHLDIMKIGSRLRIAGISGTDRLHTISWRNVDSDIWNVESGSPTTSCDIHLDTAGTYEIYGRFKINGEYVNTETTRFKVIE